MNIRFGETVFTSDAPISVYDAARAAGLISREHIAAKVNGKLTELTHVIYSDADVELLTFESEDGKHVYRHTASHILAQAVKRLYPEVKLTIGPAVENGFYYDFDSDVSFTPDVLDKLEAEMKKIIKENHKIERFELPREEAVKLMTERDEPYKVELINELPADAVISFYRQGEFVDLCAGPHLFSTGTVKAVKLTQCTGAYWKGDQKNKMLQRVYGIAFPNKDEMKKYLDFLEEAKKRDHRKLGRELDLYDIMDEGPGFPFFYPKGMVLRNLLEDYWRQIHRKAGYEEIKTPMILNRQLWETSGHWDHYRENMYTTKIDDEDYAIKPMNCPGGMLVYKRKLWSYKELPCRCGELGLVHRHELSGALHGLMRVRCFTQDDAHIFMTPEQIKDEIIGVYKLIDQVYTTFGLPYTIELSTRPENSIGSDEMWELATNGLKGALDEIGKPYIINEGDGAFYGPKIDFHLRDCLGRTWQCGTIQLDFQMPLNFNLEYVDVDGSRKRPIMIHRVCYGSIERFIGILTEHFAGKFPTWMAPVQVKVLPVSDKSMDYAKTVYAALRAKKIRCELDDRNEKIGYKIREARQVDRVPYMLILGGQEVENNTVSVRDRATDQTVTCTLDEFIAKISKEIADRV